jgi:hypothetical protein
MSNQVKNLPDFTRPARNYLNPADLPITRLINPIVYVALKSLLLHLTFLLASKFSFTARAGSSS